VLQKMLIVSVVAHAGLLAVRFAPPDLLERMRADAPMQVVLVNARSDAPPPERAQAVAQATLAGGGEADRGRATTPLPYAPEAAIGDSFEEAQRRNDALQQQQTQLLAQIRDQVAQLPVPDPRRPADSGDEAAEEEKRRQLLRLLAEIERRVNEENARPRKRYVSPATREAVYAAYYDVLRRRIEERGTAEFPEDQGRKLYGDLTMVITVDRDGRLLETEVVQGSGNPALDRQARAIVGRAGPFGGFDAALRAKVDQLAMVARFKFTRDATLETNVR
jgi:protein TonB